MSGAALAGRCSSASSPVVASSAVAVQLAAACWSPFTGHCSADQVRQVAGLLIAAPPPVASPPIGAVHHLKSAAMEPFHESRVRRAA